MSLVQDNVKAMEAINQRILEFIDSEYKGLGGNVKTGGLLIVCAQLICVISSLFSINTKIKIEDAVKATMDTLHEMAMTEIEETCGQVKTQLEAQKCATNADS